LRITAPNAPSPVLVVHPVRAVEGERIGQDSLPLADPVETLLDLYELRLTDQAEHMVARLRAGRDGK
jgi:hypothetical protein